MNDDKANRLPAAPSADGPSAPGGGASTPPQGDIANRGAALPPRAGGASGLPPVPRERRHRAVGWQSRDVLRAAALVVALYVAVRLLWFAHQLAFVVFLGVLFGLAVSSAVDRLERFRIRRGIGAALVVLSFFGLLGLFGAWMAPTLREQSRELRARLPQAVDKIEAWVDSHQSGLLGMMLPGDGPGADSAATGGAIASRTAATPAPGDSGRGAGTRADSAAAGSTVGGDSTAGGPAASGGSDSASAGGLAPSARLKERIGAQLGSATRYLFPFLSQTVAIFAALLLVVFLAIYVGAEPVMYRRGLMHLFPHKARKRADEVLHAMAVALRKWLVTQLIAMAAIGVVTTVALLILQVKAAVALGILAGLFEFIPTVGPLISAIPAIAMAFLDSPEKALIVAIVYMGIQFLENHILIPLLMKGGVDLPPALTVVAQALMALVFGFIGLMVAVPMLAAVMVPIKMLYVEDVVGDQIEVLDDEDDDG